MEPSKDVWLHLIGGPQDGDRPSALRDSLVFGRVLELQWPSGNVIHFYRADLPWSGEVSVTLHYRGWAKAMGPS